MIREGQWTHVPGRASKRDPEWMWERHDPQNGGCIAKVYFDPGDRRFGWPARWIADCLDGKPSAHADSKAARAWADGRLARKVDA